MHAEQAQVGHRWLRRRPKLELFEFVSMFMRPHEEIPANAQFFDHERLNAELARDDYRRELALDVRDLACGMADSRSVYDGTHDRATALRRVFQLDRMLHELGGLSTNDEHDWAWWLLEAVAKLIVSRAEHAGVSTADIKRARDLLDYARDELDERRADALDETEYRGHNGAGED